jgi:hypothetical protein
LVNFTVIEFDSRISVVEFFFVHLEEDSPLTATALASDGSELATVTSNIETTFGDSDNFMGLAGDRPIATIEITGGLGAIAIISFLD